MHINILYAGVCRVCADSPNRLKNVNNDVLWNVSSAKHYISIGIALPVVVSFPAVRAAGLLTDGLQGGNDGCSCENETLNVV